MFSWSVQGVNRFVYRRSDRPSESRRPSLGDVDEEEWRCLRRNDDSFRNQGYNDQQFGHQREPSRNQQHLLQKDWPDRKISMSEPDGFHQSLQSPQEESFEYRRMHGGRPPLGPHHAREDYKIPRGNPLHDSRGPSTEFQGHSFSAMFDRGLRKSYLQKEKGSEVSHNPHNPLMPPHDARGPPPSIHDSQSISPHDPRGLPSSRLPPAHGQPPHNVRGPPHDPPVHNPHGLPRGPHSSNDSLGPPPHDLCDIPPRGSRRVPPHDSHHDHHGPGISPHDSGVACNTQGLPSYDPRGPPPRDVQRMLPHDPRGHSRDPRGPPGARGHPPPPRGPLARHDPRGLPLLRGSPQEGRSSVHNSRGSDFPHPHALHDRIDQHPGTLPSSVSNEHFPPADCHPDFHQGQSDPRISQHVSQVVEERYKLPPLSQGVPHQGGYKGSPLSLEYQLENVGHYESHDPPCDGRGEIGWSSRGERNEKRKEIYGDERRGGGRGRSSSIRRGSSDDRDNPPTKHPRN